jgi:SAM-dependent methyltransferase
MNLSKNIIMKKIFFKILLILMVMVGMCGLGINQEHSHEQNQQKDRDRWLWQQPEMVMDVLGVKEGMVIADIGAGEGYFTFRLARRIGQNGLVYANEINKEITTILGEPDDPLLPEKKIDIALLVNLIHLVDQPVVFLKNIKPCLKPEGTLVLVQWDAEKLLTESPGGSLEDVKEFLKEDLLKKIQTAGYEVIRTETFLSMQNIYICRWIATGRRSHEKNNLSLFTVHRIDHISVCNQ